MKKNCLIYECGLGERKNTLMLAVRAIDLFMPTTGRELTVPERWNRYNIAHLVLRWHKHTEHFLELHAPIIIDKHWGTASSYFEGAHRQFEEEFATKRVGFA